MSTWKKKRRTINITNENSALNALYGDDYLHEQLSEGQAKAERFIAQMDAYYASPSSSFHDNNIARRFYEQRLRHLRFTPYPKDGLVTFGASGTNKCDREIVFKNAKVKVTKSPDIPFRSRQRRVGSAVIEYVQLDLAHMQKRLGDDAEFTLIETPSGEWAMEDAVATRQVFEHNGVKFAITVKPDGLFQDREGNRYIFEYKTKAAGVVEMNGKLDYSGAQADHLRQVTAEALVYGIDEGFIVYESMHKPSWFSDEERKNVPKTRKTWKNGEPIPDMRAMYFRITDEMKTQLLDDLARQAELVDNGEIPEITLDMVQKCAFCPFSDHCKSILTEEEINKLKDVERNLSQSVLNDKYEHRNLKQFLGGV